MNPWEEGPAGRALAFFYDICRIPRGSGNEKAVADYVLAVAERLGLWAYRDEAGNVYVKKPGSPGKEDHPAILFQSHLDMVCEKDDDVDHDFLKDPIDYYVDGEWLKARGTSLGADDGTGVAFMLAILENNELTMPPVECLFTVEEETGLIGAGRIETKHIDARRMVNLDCGPEGVFLASCAGGMTGTLQKHVRMEPVQGKTVKIKVDGLMGGHSGSRIHWGLGNAIKILTRALRALDAQIGIRLCRLEGGGKDNAIPRICGATVALMDDGSRLDALVKELSEGFRAELIPEDQAGFTLTCEEVKAESMFSAEDSDAILDLLQLFPNGVMAQQKDNPVPVVTSINLANVSVKDGTFVAQYSIRSNIESLKEETAATVRTLAGRMGAEIEEANGYPGWSFAPESELRKLCVEVYERFTGLKATVEGVHAGLECGLVQQKIPDMDIVGTGSTATGAHSTKESMNLPSFERTYGFLLELLKTL